MKLYAVCFDDLDNGPGMQWVSNKRDIPAMKKQIIHRGGRVAHREFHIMETELPMKKKAVIAFLNKWAGGNYE